MGDGTLNRRINSRFRVNDPYAATHPSYYNRKEPLGNGLMLITFDEALREIDAARIVIEGWGGHPDTTNRRLSVNGRSTYSLPVANNNQCNQLQLSLPINITDLVRGENAIQFAVDGEETFWGHFIIDECALDARLMWNDPRVVSIQSLGGMPPAPFVAPLSDESFELTFPVADTVAFEIDAVHYIGFYEGYDENGDGLSRDWHVATKKKVPFGHIGTSRSAPYPIVWDTSMLVAQSDVKVIALVEFHNTGEVAQEESRRFSSDDPYWKSQGLYYQSGPTETFSITHPDGISVAYVRSEKLSTPFWSRVNREKTCEFHLPVPIESIQTATLSNLCWDGGAGDESEYFTLNNYFLPIADNGNHDTIYRVLDVPPNILQQPINRARLKSSTEHHGIEILMPGPMLTIRYIRF